MNDATFNIVSSIVVVVFVVLVAAFFWWAFGFHIVHKPTAAQLFGCGHTYINDKGEDTGECR